MKQEPIDLRNIPVQKSTQHQNKAFTDPLVKIEDGEEQKTRLKRRLRQLTTSESSNVADSTDSIEETHDPERENDSLYCKTCKYSYETREVYLTHQIHFHWDELPENYCNFCDRTYYSKHTHLRHLKNVHNINIHHKPKVKIRNHNIIPDIYDQNNFCSACEYTFASKAIYRYHLKNTHGIQLPNDLKTLKKLNSDIIPDICDPNNFCKVCENTFSDKSKYHNHLSNVHSMYVPKKSERNKILYPDRIPDIHDSNNFCCACDRTYFSRHTYRNHLKSTHGIKIERQLKLRSFDKIPDIDDPNNFCNVCDHAYSRKSDYHRHLRGVHAIQLPKRYAYTAKICYPSRIPDINDPNFFCNACDHTFSSKQKYRYHLKNIHAIQVLKKNQLSN